MKHRSSARKSRYGAFLSSVVVSLAFSPKAHCLCRLTSAATRTWSTAYPIPSTFAWVSLPPRWDTEPQRQTLAELSKSKATSTAGINPNRRSIHTTTMANLSAAIQSGKQTSLSLKEVLKRMNPKAKKQRIISRNSLI